MKPSVFFALLAFALGLFSCKTNEAGFTKKDIRHSQKLIGLEFEKERIDVAYNYLKENKSGYDSLRAYPVPYDTGTNAAISTSTLCSGCCFINSNCFWLALHELMKQQPEHKVLVDIAAFVPVS